MFIRFRDINNHNKTREKASWIELYLNLCDIVNESHPDKRFNAMMMFLYNFPHIVKTYYSDIILFNKLKNNDGMLYGIILSVINRLKETNMKITWEQKYNLCDRIYKHWLTREVTNTSNHNKLSKTLILMKHIKLNTSDNTSTIHFYADMLISAYEHNKMEMIRKYTLLTISLLIDELKHEIK